MAKEYRLILKNIDSDGYTPDLECYVRHGGYQTLQKALKLPPKIVSEEKTISVPEQIRDEVKLS